MLQTPVLQLNKTGRTGHMTTFETAITALAEGKQVKRAAWENGSSMYADSDRQLMRSNPSQPGVPYNWVLDFNDVTATDWQVVSST
jgi:hypothetical protein